jgi:hypothetical protein
MRGSSEVERGLTKYGELTGFSGSLGGVGEFWARRGGAKAARARVRARTPRAGVGFVVLLGSFRGFMISP